MDGAAGSRELARRKIIEATSRLLTEGGRDVVSTRSVCLAAGIQPPTIYRIFGDMRGLLDAVAGKSFADYLAQEAVRPADDDPVDDLRAGWDAHVGFGLSHPGMYSLIYGEPRPGLTSPAAQEALRVVARLVSKVAAAGRLRIDEEQASALLIMAGSGATLFLIGLPEAQRDLTLSHLARETVVAAITTEPAVSRGSGVVGAGLALRAHLDEAEQITPAERALLREWIGRIVS